MLFMEMLNSEWRNDVAFRSAACSDFSHMCIECHSFKAPTGRLPMIDEATETVRSLQRISLHHSSEEKARSFETGRVQSAMKSPGIRPSFGVLEAFHIEKSTGWQSPGPCLAWKDEQSHPARPGQTGAGHPLSPKQSTLPLSRFDRHLFLWSLGPPPDWIVFGNRPHHHKKRAHGFP